MAGEQLLVTEGKERGTRLSVASDLLIGRMAPKQEGRLGEDPELSRRHAYISRGTDGQLTIDDLGSANGTFVNGERIDAPRTLDPGDVVKVGQTVLEVSDPSGAMAAKTRVPTGAGAGKPAPVIAEPDEVLVVTAGTALGRRLTLGDEIVIGRMVSGEGELSDDVELSRRHARIARDARGELSIEDLGSANGTFVNGERVRGLRVLKVGDSVRVGSTTLRVDRCRAGTCFPSRSNPGPRPREQAARPGGARPGTAGPREQAARPGGARPGTAGPREQAARPGGARPCGLRCGP